MLPGKIFFQAIKSDDKSNSTKPNHKLNLVLNEIYYDQLKQFHTKYLCVSANDVLTLELYSLETPQLLGVTVISDVYKHILDNRTVEVKTKGKDAGSMDVTMKLVFQTVSSYNRRRSPSNTKRGVEDTIHRSPIEKERETIQHQTELSFSNNRDHFNESIGNISRASFQGTGTIQLQAIASKDGEGESLQSLAQQREKILGELFGKFKRQR